MSLSDKLDAIREGGEKNIPAPALEQMHRATRELQESDIFERIIKPGELLPAFELPNQENQTISSESLLSQGPLVMTVYRGLW